MNIQTDKIQRLTTVIIRQQTFDIRNTRRFNSKMI